MSANNGEPKEAGVGSASSVLFAATLIALGLLGLAKGRFTPVWEPVPKGVPARGVLAYVCATVFLGSGLGLFWRRSACGASRLLVGSLLLWWLCFRIPYLFLAPSAVDSWSGAAEMAVMVAGAWVCYAGCAAGSQSGRFGFFVGASGLRIARCLYGLAMIPFGTAHFAYIKETASLVPSWLPAHLALAYLTGCAFLAAGLAILTDMFGRLAATLAALQLGLFTLLVWAPIVLAGTKDTYQISEAILSWTLSVAAWVVADSYRGVPWLAVKYR